MIADALQRISRRVGRQFDRVRRRVRQRPPGSRQTLKDRALARHLRDTFEQDWEVADVQGVHFYVKGGVVTVYGTVRHDLGRELLLSFIRQQPGVEAAESHLSIETR